MSDWAPSPLQQERNAWRRRQSWRRGLVATLATAVFFGVLTTLVTSSAGWPTFRTTFLNGHQFVRSMPEILHGFVVNIEMFLVTEPAILALALAVAVARQTRSAWLFPIRFVAVLYTDLLRGIPTLVLVYLLGLGMPALQLTGVPSSPFFWSAASLVLSYGAYVAEVFRAGIESVHPSQRASAAALGLSRPQAMRYIVVPQAVRRVVPPLLNDFVSLQKDTSLVSSVAVFDGLFAARDYSNYHFTFTPYVGIALCFVVLTVPLARLTDALASRARRREFAGSIL